MYNQLRLCVLNNFTQLLIKIKSLLGDHLCLFVLTVSRCRLLSPLSIVQKIPSYTSPFQLTSLLIQVNIRQAYGKRMLEMNSDTSLGFKWQIWCQPSKLSGTEVQSRLQHIGYCLPTFSPCYFLSHNPNYNISPPPFPGTFLNPFLDV